MRILNQLKKDSFWIIAVLCVIIIILSWGLYNNVDVYERCNLYWLNYNLIRCECIDDECFIDPYSQDKTINITWNEYIERIEKMYRDNEYSTNEVIYYGNQSTDQNT